MQVEFAFKPVNMNVSDTALQSHIPNKSAAYEAGLITASDWVNKMKVAEVVEESIV